jgi:hypothetical protein
MAKLSDLVSKASDVTGMPAATVREVSRRLREAGLIRTGKGGRYGGADMMPQDAAALLTALIIVRTSAASLSDIGKRTNLHLRDLKSYSGSDRVHLARWDRRLAMPSLCRLPPGHTFGEAFSSLITSISNGELERCIAKWAQGRPPGVGPFFTPNVQIASPRPYLDAKIGFETPAFGALELYYFLPREAKDISIVSAPRKWSDIVVDHSGFDLQVTASVGEMALKAIGLLLRNSGKQHA